MATGDPRWDLIHGGILVSQGGVITGAGTLENTFVPERATAINAHTGIVLHVPSVYVLTLTRS
jgi:hypothetical protein